MLKKNQVSDSSYSGVAYLRAILLFACVALSLNAAAGEKLVSITTKKTNDVTSFFVQNLQSAEVTVTIEAKLTNYKSEKPLPVTLTLAPKSKAEAFKVSAIDAKAEATWSYTYFATWGNRT